VGWPQAHQLTYRLGDIYRWQIPVCHFLWRHCCKSRVADRPPIL